MLVDAGQITVTNPGTGEVLGTVPAMSVDDVDAVIAGHPPRHRPIWR